ncbi:MAG: hypothetical protein ACOC23_02990, partial [Thermodesulfobacteriota bacterium]
TYSMGRKRIPEDRLIALQNGLSLFPAGSPEKSRSSRISRTPAVYPSARSIALFADCRIRKG